MNVNKYTISKQNGGKYMQYIENKYPCCLDEIDWGNGRKFKCNSYWNDDTSFALDFVD